MSRTPSLAMLGIALIGVMGSAAPLSAQSDPSRERELIAEIDALRPRLEEARARAEEARQLRAAAVRQNVDAMLDTVTVGPMRIVVFEGDGELATELFGEVWRRWFVGFDESPSLSSTVFTFQWRSRLRRFPVFAEEGTSTMPIEPSRVWAPSRAGVLEIIREGVATAATRDFPVGSPMNAWSSAFGHPGSESVYRLLAVTPTEANRACLRGEIAGCEGALGLRLRAHAARLADWYTFEQRQAMVLAEMDESNNPRLDYLEPRAQACREGTDASACDAILAELDWASSTPLSDLAATHLLWHAVRLGGEDAWTRARERRDAPPADLLEHVAALPLDELVASWQAELAANRPRAYAGLGVTKWSVLFWCLLFAMCAMRSTRWRLE